MRSPVTIYISQVLHEKQEIFFTKQRANAVFNAICACTDNELIFSGSCRVFQSSQEKSNTMVMQKFWGVYKVHYGLGEDGEFAKCTSPKLRLVCPQTLHNLCY